MGYTHYTEYTAMTESEFRAIVADAAILRRVARTSHGVRSRSRTDFEVLTFELNGIGEERHEPYRFMAGDMFVLRAGRYSPEFFCCKTQRKPYDMIVGACMISMKQHMGDRVVIYSDGVLEEPDWGRAFALYHEAFPDRPPPPTPFFRTPDEAEAAYEARYGAMKAPEVAAPSGSRWRFGAALA